jgi:DNA primase
MPGVDYRAVRTSISLAQVLELIGFSARELRGDQGRGPCPIHGASSSQSGSFSANLSKNTYRCFTCGSSGNQPDLWAAVTKQDLHQATISLCERLDMAVPTLRRPATSRAAMAPARTEKRNP